ncbi:hypothetical protein Bca4012_084315 [Brassica carinata]
MQPCGCNSVDVEPCGCNPMVGTCGCISKDGTCGCIYMDAAPVDGTEWIQQSSDYENPMKPLLCQMILQSTRS